VSGNLSQKVATLFVSQIDTYRALVPGNCWPPKALTLVRYAPRAHRITAVWRLNLDDVGAVVTEKLTREGTRDETAAL
jgi:hypothetical protein